MSEEQMSNVDAAELAFYQTGFQGFINDEAKQTAKLYFTWGYRKARRDALKSPVTATDEGINYKTLSAFVEVCRMIEGHDGLAGRPSIPNYFRHWLDRQRKQGTWEHARLTLTTENQTRNLNE